MRWPPSTFLHGSLVLTEAGSKRRASLHVLRGEEALRSIDPGGVEIFATDLDGFRAALSARKPHPQARPHRSAPHQRCRQRLLRRNSPRRSAFAHHSNPQAQTRRVGAPLFCDALHAHSLDRSPPRRGAEKLSGKSHGISSGDGSTRPLQHALPALRRKGAAHSLRRQRNQLLRQMPDRRQGARRPQPLAPSGF